MATAFPKIIARDEFFLAQKGCSYPRDSEYLIIFDKV